MNEAAESIQVIMFSFTCISVLPAVTADDFVEAIFFAVRVRTPRSRDEASLAATMIDVLEDWNDVDVLQSDVDSDLRVSVPEEVRLLLDVRHVVGRLQVPCIVQILHEQIVGMFDAKSWSRDVGVTIVHDFT